MRSVLGLTVLLFGVEVIFGQDGQVILGGCDFLPGDDKYLEESRNMISEKIYDNPTQQDVEGCTTIINIDNWTTKKDCVWNAKTEFNFSFTVTTTYECPACTPCDTDCQEKNIAPVSYTCYAGTNINSEGSVYFPEGEEPRCVAG